MIFNQHDKKLHFYLGCLEAWTVIVMSMIVLDLFDVSMPVWLKIAGGTLAALADGLDKEQDDKLLGTGTPEFMDWYAQAFGGLVASLAIVYLPWIVMHPLAAVKGYAVFISAYIIRMLIYFFWLIIIANRYGPYYEHQPRWLRPFVVVFFVLDVVLNYCLLFFYFELPAIWRETVSERIADYSDPGYDRRGLLRQWRYHSARFFCWLLDFADIGHCRHNRRRRHGA